MVVACLHIHTLDSHKNQSIEAYLSIFIHLKNNKHNRYNSDNHSPICPEVAGCVFASVFAHVVSVAQLVARRTHDRKVVGSIPTNAVCFTVVR